MRPNWPLIAILSAAAVTLVLVLMIVLSPPTYSGPEVATVDEVSLTEAEAVPVTGTIAGGDGCFFLRSETGSGDNLDAYLIWPTGFVRSENTVTGPDGRVFAAGETVSTTAVVTDRATVVGSNEFLNRLTGSCMGGDDTGDVAAVFSIE